MLCRAQGTRRAMPRCSSVRNIPTRAVVNRPVRQPVAQCHARLTHDGSSKAGSVTMTALATGMLLFAPASSYASHTAGVNISITPPAAVFEFAAPTYNPAAAMVQAPALSLSLVPSTPQMASGKGNATAAKASAKAANTSANSGCGCIDGCKCAPGSCNCGSSCSCGENSGCGMDNCSCGDNCNCGSSK